MQRSEQRIVHPTLAAVMVAWAMAASWPASGQDLRTSQHEDIEFLRHSYLSRERAFTPETRAEAERFVDRLEAQAGSLSNEQLFLGFARVAAIADNGHSVAGVGRAYQPRARLPLIFEWFDDAGLAVLRALPPNGDLAGGIVTRINGRSANEVLDTFRQYYGGSSARRNILATSLLQIADMLVAGGAAVSGDSVSLRVRLPDGSETERNIATVPVASVGERAWWPSRWWSPAPIHNDATPWSTAISARDLPLYLVDGDAYNRAVALPELNAVYLQLKSSDAEREARLFASRADAVLRSARAANIIVDLRFDNGGDMSITADFLQSLPRRLGTGGRLFVIVGRYTFSAGIGAAAILLNAGGERAILVGEDMGDRPRFFSEGAVVCAPHSGFCLRYTDGLYDLAVGCEGQFLCRPENRRYHLAVGSLRPRIFAPITWADYLAKRDPAMEAIRTAIRH